MTPPVKTCFKCGKTLPLSEFYRHPQMLDGHLNKCKECTKKDARENRAKNVFYYRQYDCKRAMNPERVLLRQKYAQSEHCKIYRANRLREYRKLYPEKNRAHNLVRQAVISGKIIKKPCEICGTLNNVQGHHEDYSKPLDVIWLCPIHHGWIHR